MAESPECVDLSVDPEDSVSAIDSRVLKKRKYSQVYDHFTLLQNGPDKGKHKCNYCSAVYKIEKGATSSALRPLRGNHPRNISEEEPTSEITTLTNYFQSGTCTSPQFSEDEFRRACVRLCVARDLPFSFVDWAEFRTLCTMLRPHLTFLSRRTLCREIDVEYHREVQNLKVLLGSVSSKISLTMDEWTARNQLPFLGITYHYICADWMIHHGLLAFEPFPGEHSGSKLAEKLLEVLQRYDILNKLVAVTTDNASNNSTMMQHFRDELEHEDIDFQPEWQWIRCLCHCLNLSVQDFLSHFKSKVFEKKDCENWDEQEHDDAENNDLSDKPLSKLKLIVRKIRRSPQLIRTFGLTCTANNEQSGMPVIDVKTRWNSTHSMIDFALARKKSFTEIAQIKRWGSLVILESDWEILQQISSILQVFARATDMASGSKYATLFLGCPIYQAIWNELEKNEKRFLRSNPQISQACSSAKLKLEKYYDLQSPIAVIATILDPRRGFQFFSTIWAEEREWLDLARQHFEEAFNVYQDRHSNPDSSYPATTARTCDIFGSVGRPEVAVAKSELCRYMELAQVDLDVQPVIWWKANSRSFPILSTMARDYLAIQASSVPCEQAFSASGNIVTPDRNRLSEDSIEKCMFLKYRFRL